MRRIALVSASLVVFAATSAAAQTSQPRVEQLPTAPGVDVWQPVNQKTPQATQSQGYTTEPIPYIGPFQPRGFDAGAFTVFPSITVGTFYDDNVFALPNNKLDDWAYFVRPEIALRSNNWSNVQFLATAYLEAREYRRYSSEDQVNGAVAAASTITVNPDTQIVSRLQYLRAHEERGLSDTITQRFNEPIAYDQFDAAIALNNRYGRFYTSVGAAGQWIDYENASLNGVTISQDYRDGFIGRVPARLGYVVAPLTSVFVEVAANRRDFDVNYFDSEGYRVVGGMLFEPGQGARVKGEFFGGYMHQDYNGITLLPVSTWTYGAAMAWLLRDDITFGFEGRREAKETSLSGGVVPFDGLSIVQTVAIARFDYRILRNVSIGAGISFVEDDFQGIAREDHSYGPLASVKWYVNPILTLGFDYRNVDFGSSGLGIASYVRNVYLFSANAKF